MVGDDWTDLARNAPGIGVSYEAARRRQAEGVDAGRSWQVGADGEIAVAAVLAQLITPSGWDRLRRRTPAWRVLHSVPLHNHRGETRGDVDHLVLGVPGVVSINIKHHRKGRLELDGDALTVNGHSTNYVRRARLEAVRVRELLAAALAAARHPQLAARVTVAPVLVVVGGRLLVTRWASGVSVVMTRQLLHTLNSRPVMFSPSEVEQVFAIARRSTTWIPAGVPQHGGQHDGQDGGRPPTPSGS